MKKLALANKLSIISIAAATVLIATMLATLDFSVFAVSATNNLKADLDGFQEVPAISSSGSGEFRVRLSSDETSIDFELSYSGLEGTVQQAHIHIGQPGVNGGIIVFLCTNLANAPSPTIPSCPQEGTVTGTRTAADVIGPAGQGIAAGEFDEFVTALRADMTYANVHTSKHPGGEIRGHIR